MLRRSQFRRKPLLHEPSREKEPRPLAKPERWIAPGSVADSVVAVPKEPADRNATLRRLAEGEQCTVPLPTCHCLPEQVVWAHTNTQTDRKGLGYKGSDSAGFFAGYECHALIDQGGLSEETVAELVAVAQCRTAQRLREIAGNPALKPWRVEAARWALDRIEGGQK